MNFRELNIWLTLQKLDIGYARVIAGHTVWRCGENLYQIENKELTFTQAYETIV